MKKIILTLISALFAGFSLAQVSTGPSLINSKGQLQFSLFGGFSSALKDYRKDVGRAKNGYFYGLAIDQFFTGNQWGIGVDVRYLKHGIRKFESVSFANGNLTTNYHNEPAFKHLGVSIGPTYKAALGEKVELEAFLRTGILFQQFPAYVQSIYVNAPEGAPVKMFDDYYTNNEKNKAKAWMGLGGLRVTYQLSDRVGVFLQTDYLNTFGKRFGGDSSRFHVMNYKPTNPLGPKDVLVVKNGVITNINQFYESRPCPCETNVKALNLAAGVKIKLGGKRKKLPLMPVIVVPVAISKEIQVVVKDKQTGLVLSGVKVKISGNGKEYVSNSNVNGEAERVKSAIKSGYLITAEKNGVVADPVGIKLADFETDAAVIYKEIFLNDLRFTLIGETIRSNDNSKLPGISTVLTNTFNNESVGQLSDGQAMFTYQLEQESEYTVVATEAGKFSQTELVSTKGLDRSKTLYVVLKLGLSDISVGATFILKNIHYDFDKSNIRADAAPVLDNLVNIMVKNPSLRIELSSHTDSRGKDDYNEKLSRRRAASAVSYLLGKGIGRSRLVDRGYGERQLLNRCANGVKCTPGEHEANRRTEIKVLKY